jgi:hypothetical protein
MSSELQQVSSSDDQLQAIACMSDAELDRMLAVLRGRIEEEFQITERVDAKSRQLFALAAGAFAGAQAAAYAALASAAVSHSEKIATLVLSAAGALALGLLMFLLHSHEGLREERDLNPALIRDWCQGDDGTNVVSARLVLALSRVAQLRASSNKARNLDYERFSQAVRCVLLLYTAQLVFALAVRV